MNKIPSRWYHPLFVTHLNTITMILLRVDYDINMEETNNTKMREEMSSKHIRILHPNPLWNTFPVALNNEKCLLFDSYVGHSEPKTLFVVFNSSKNTHFFGSIVGHSSQMRAHSCVSRARDRKHWKRYFDPLTMQKCHIFIDPKPQKAPPTCSLQDTRILRILVRGDEYPSIPEGIGEGYSK